ncbi:MAG: hypothetical protein KKA16_01540 [Alphaproteobacteria bacterium]|nr:hypothetical protein [Alphaproteobacteria bacterium]MBU2379562.1 hypothetical protein [Alphaproteobacteria bacterium]
MARGRTGSLLNAVSDELAEMRVQLDDLAELTSELIAHCPPNLRASALSRLQALDLLAQRLDGLSGFSAALGVGVPVDTALQALTLSDLSDRLGGRVDPSASAPPMDGDVTLFD